MANKFMNQAKQTMQKMTNRKKQNQQYMQDEQSKQSIQESIQSAYEQGSPEEQQELKNFEQKMNSKLK